MIEATYENLPPQTFCHLDSLLDGKMTAEIRKKAIHVHVCVCGYHVYNDIWEAAVGEVLVCVREPRNAYDKYAVAVEKDGTTIGHLPKFCDGKKFGGLIFVVEGTHENTTKISAYMYLGSWTIVIVGCFYTSDHFVHSINIMYIM